MQKEFWSKISEIAERNGLKLKKSDNAKVFISQRNMLVIDGIYIDSFYYRITFDSYFGILTEKREVIEQPLSKVLYTRIEKDEFMNVDRIISYLDEKSAKKIAEELISLGKANDEINDFLRNTNNNIMIFSDIISPLENWE